MRRQDGCDCMLGVMTLLLSMSLVVALPMVDSEGRSAYLVKLGNAPSVVARAVLEPDAFPRPDQTKTGPYVKVDVDSAAVQAYIANLESSHAATLARANLKSDRLFASYTFLSNAFAASLTPTEAKLLLQDPAVASVVKDKFSIKAQSSHTPAFLGLETRAWPLFGGASFAGEDVIIGVIDSGVWAEHAALKDSSTKRYTAPPARWRGSCTTTRDFLRCDRKLIGARYFIDGFLRAGGVPKADVEHVSPRDSNGHGSHVASIAGGNPSPVTINGLSFGMASGAAPRARLASYKVLWTDESGAQGATLIDTLSAVEQAARDGVDVINYSLGGGTDFLGIVELALLEAASVGIMSSGAVGNDGTVPDSMHNSAPWQVTVAATTTDRRYSHTVTLQTTPVSSFPGTGYTAGTASNSVLVIGNRVALAFADPARANECYPGTLDGSRVSGKVVICSRGAGIHPVEQADVVKALGAAGLIICENHSESPPLEPLFYSLPAVSVSYSAGLSIIAYANSARSPFAMISPINTAYTARAPAVGSFSTTGPISSSPASALNYVLKPDVGAPGVEIWGAWTADESVNGAYMRANVASGTSVAAAHTAGVLALLRKRYPGWTAYAIKSAVTTSAQQTDNWSQPIGAEDGAPRTATAFEIGSGFLNAAGALDPGLVFDSSRDEMVRFLMSIDPARARSSFYIPAGTAALVPTDLNVPNIALPALGTAPVVFRRTVTSVSLASETYAAAVALASPYVRVTVTPSSFTVAPGMTQAIEVRFERTGVPGPDASGALAPPVLYHGSITYSSSAHTVVTKVAVGVNRT